MMMRKSAVAGVLALAALAGCGGSPATSGTITITAPSGQIANPVPILRKTGVPVPASERYGTVGCCGDRVASGTFPGGEAVFVFTYDSRADMNTALANHVPQDGEASIQGPGLSLLNVDMGYSGPNNPWGGPTPQQIAARIGGTVLPG